MIALPLGAGCPIRALIAGFETWILTDFARADRSIEAYGLDHGDLVYLLAPWIETAYQIIEPRLPILRREDAKHLRGLITHVLGRIERHCDRFGERLSDMLIEIAHCDALLITLALAERGHYATTHAASRHPEHGAHPISPDPLTLEADSGAVGTVAESRT